MKLKKKTSIMLAASAAVAAVGIAAVSFAAWTGNNATTLTAEAATGQATYFGFNATPQTAEFDKDLVPFDQKSGYDANACATAVTVAVPAFTVLGDYSVTVEITSIKNSQGEDVELAANSAFYVAEGTQTAPTTIDTTWKPLSDEAAIVITGTTSEVSATVSGKTLTFILKSSDGADMDLDVQFAIKLVDGSQS